MDDIHPIDRWLIVHYLTGSYLKKRGLTANEMLEALILWEVFESQVWPGYRETYANAFWDVVVGAFAYRISK
jgi:hypothetical protein